MEQWKLESEQGGDTYIAGISGISSSGKTTLARHIRRLFTDLTIPAASASQSAAEPPTNVVGSISFDVSLLHQDDFFFPESALPIRTVTIKRKVSAHEESEKTVNMEDWDFPGAVNFVAFENALRLLCQGVSYLDVLQSLGIQQIEGLEATDVQTVTAPVKKTSNTVSEKTLDEMRMTIVSKFNAAREKSPQYFRKNLRINLIIVDGFMLYHQDDPDVEQTNFPIPALLDLKLLLRAPYALIKKRRESRNGYAASEGYWTDPEGYFDGIVWPNYVLYHRHLFVGGDVQAAALTEEWGPEGRGVELQPEHHESMEDLVRWASGRFADIILKGIEKN